MVAQVLYRASAPEVLENWPLNLCLCTLYSYVFIVEEYEDKNFVVNEESKPRMYQCHLDANLSLHHSRLLFYTVYFMLFRTKKKYKLTALHFYYDYLCAGGMGNWVCYKKERQWLGENLYRL